MVTPDNLPVADELAQMGFDVFPKDDQSFRPPETQDLKDETERLSKKKDVILNYRDLQELQLTEVQSKLLQAITDRKIAEAPLRELVGAFKILKDKELVANGKPTEIKGLVGYLMLLEEEEKQEEELITTCEEVPENDEAPEHSHARRDMEEQDRKVGEKEVLPYFAQSRNQQEEEKEEDRPKELFRGPARARSFHQEEQGENPE